MRFAQIFLSQDLCSKRFTENVRVLIKLMIALYEQYLTRDDSFCDLCFSIISYDYEKILQEKKYLYIWQKAMTPPIYRRRNKTDFYDFLTVFDSFRIFL